MPDYGNVCIQCITMHAPPALPYALPIHSNSDSMAERIPDKEMKAEQKLSKEAERIRYVEKDLEWIVVKSVKDIDKNLPTKVDPRKVCWICAYSPSFQLEKELEILEIQDKNQESFEQDSSLSEEEEGVGAGSSDEDDKLSTFEKEGREIIDKYMSDVVSKKKRASAEDKKQFVSNLYALATKHGIVSGKWLVFPSTKHIDRKWRLIARETLRDNLGNAAKVSPCSEEYKSVICVYCEDFNDKPACEKVVRCLEELGIHISAPFKADAITRLGLYREDFQKLQIIGCWGLHYDLIG